MAYLKIVVSEDYVLIVIFQNDFFLWNSPVEGEMKLGWK